MNSTNKSNLYRSLTLLIVVLAVFFGASYLKQKKWENLEKDGVIAIGTLYDTGGSHLRFKFKVGDKYYSIGRKKPYYYLKNDEQYEVRYSQEDPKNAIIYFDRPVMSDGFTYLETPCKSIDKKISSIRFKYEVNDLTVTRIKFFHDGESLNPNSYIVKYRQEDPEIGYLIERTSQ